MIHQLSTEEGIGLLTDYEYKVLIQYCDPENLNDVSKLLEQMKKAITNLAVIYARKYDSFISGVSQNILKTINEITEKIIWRSYHEDDVQIGTIISCNKEMTKLLPSSYIIEIGLKDAVVMALNRIFRDIYYFDNHNVCYRKMLLPKKSEKFEEIYKDYKNLQAEYLDFNNLNGMEKSWKYYLFEKQAKCDDIFYLDNKNDEPLKRNYNPIPINGYLLDHSEEKMLNSIYQKQIECEDYVTDEEKILTYRNEMQSILKRYYNQAFDLNPEVYEEYKYYDSEITRLENDFNQYAICLYKLQMCICENKISNECSMKQCIQYRTKVENVIIGDVEFLSYLMTFEQEFFSLFSKEHCDSEDCLNKLVRDTMDKYKEEVKYAHYETEEEIDLIENRKNNNSIYSVIDRNIDNIEKLTDQLVNEVYAIIIRLRKQDEEQQGVQESTVS